jgi:hypothetical protein
VLAQEEVKGENTIEAAFIQGLPLEGRVVTLDAGLNQREIAHAIVEKGGLLRGCDRQSRSLTRDIVARYPCQERYIATTDCAKESATRAG